jgi:coproporphyrinogen III oxidase
MPCSEAGIGERLISDRSRALKE